MSNQGKKGAGVPIHSGASVGKCALRYFTNYENF